MPTATTKTKEHQDRWNEIVRDPALRDLPYKIETNARGHILLIPHTAHHSDQQGDVMDLLRQYAPSGLVRPEFPICTEKGTKLPDVAWITKGRREEMRETGDPPTLAPEICVEVMSDSNDWDEMHEKRALYLQAGAEEVWIVSEDGNVHFFAEEELGASDIAPEFPKKV
jgi:Uma2 family endonuclease